MLTSLLTFEDEFAALGGQPHPSLFIRKIIHVDMDAFYASIEERDNPELRGKPVVVGGQPNSRGVVATCNYEARKFGIRSAMASAKACRLCPSAVFVRPRFEAYSAVSKQVKEIFLSYSKKIEMLSLDEGFLDVTEASSHKSATAIAQSIRQDVFNATNLTCSAGVAPNKMLAKIATDFQKPNGLTVLKPNMVEEFMKSLPLGKIPFVGPKSLVRLNRLGWNTCGDVIASGKSRVIEQLGAWGVELWDRVHGIDFSDVESVPKRKSIGEEHTYAEDLVGDERVYEKLKSISDSLAEDVIAVRKMAFQTIQLKIKKSDFKVMTRALTVARPVLTSDELFKIAIILWQKSGCQNEPVRLLGLSVSRFSDIQMNLSETFLF